MDIIEDYGPRYLVVLAGDHIYKMDYQPFVQAHRRHRADVTVAVRRPQPRHRREGEPHRSRDGELPPSEILRRHTILLGGFIAVLLVLGGFWFANDPVNFVDPDGRTPYSFWIGKSSSGATDLMEWQPAAALAVGLGRVGVPDPGAVEPAADVADRAVQVRREPQRAARRIEITLGLLCSKSFAYDGLAQVITEDYGVPLDDIAKVAGSQRLAHPIQLLGRVGEEHLDHLDHDCPVVVQIGLQPRQQGQ